MILVVGLVVLGVGGELLVKGATLLARRLGVSALIVGLTVVAFGTSAPEIAVTLVAGAKKEHTLAVANVIGSCTMNVLIVLGLAALARPMRVSRSVMKTDAPVMIGVIALFMLFVSNGNGLERWMGLTFLGLLVGYVLFSIRAARRQARDALVEIEFDEGMPAGRSVTASVGMLLAGWSVCPWARIGSSKARLASRRNFTSASASSV